jgi:tRNA nucleotidyltransferase (CCA-adding enzyme)
LLGGTPFDLDLVVEGDAAALAASLGGKLKVHDRFGTSTVVLDGSAYDIARSRRESYAQPGALPDVEPAPLVEDLLRRDFTVNAIAVALGGEAPGELNAAPQALEDLDARRLRVLHDRSFTDDPTRMLRLARYAARLGFSVEPHTRELVSAAIETGALGTVSGSRIGAELRLLAREDDPVKGLRSLNDLGLDRALHPGFGLSDEALARRALALLPADARPDRLAVAVAARGVPAAELPALLDSLTFEAEDRDAIVATVTRAEELARALDAAQAPSAIAAVAAGAPLELVALAGALSPEGQAREWLERLRHVRLSIDGRDLLAAGVPEGPAIGRGLRAALAAKLDGRAGERDQELAEALDAAAGA